MPSTPILRPKRQSKDVLLIETPSSTRDRHSTTLARHEYKVTLVDSIATARELWSPEKYGLIVMSLCDFGTAAADFCSEVKDADSAQVLALIFHPDQELPATDCPTLIFTTEPDEYFLARVETLTAATRAA